MKLMLAIVLCWATAQAHYVFPSLILNGQPTADWHYTRLTTNHYSNAPVTDVNSLDIRCYQLDPSGSAEATAAVRAGDTVGFTAIPNAYHPGPLSFYMARAPPGTPIEEFQGEGNVWFKIWEDQAVITPQSISWPNTGYYLLRIEQVGLHTAQALGGAQFYISCAQLNVTGGGDAAPSPLVSFPGAFRPSDPGLQINIYYPIPQSYQDPGPAVFSC